MRRREDAAASLLAGALMRELAAAGLGCPPERVRLERTAAGRPYVAEPVRGALDVNATHAGDWVAAAMTRDGRIGVDLEPVRPVSAGLVERCLAPEELAELARLPEALALSRFFQLWTAKEAYLKATGLGLARDPRSISFAITDEGAPEPRAGLSGERWRLRSWQPEPDVWLSVCCDCGLPPHLERREPEAACA